MRFAYLVLVAGCLTSLSALAESQGNEAVKAKIDDKKIVTASVTVGSSGSPKESKAITQTAKNVDSIQTDRFSDNVQGLAPSDRRYRVTD